jgi:hypothetical protein
MCVLGSENRILCTSALLRPPSRLSNRRNPELLVKRIPLMTKFHGSLKSHALHAEGDM